MQNNPPISPNAQAEEEGIWKKISGSLESAWNWAKEKVSDTWEWTKETASSAWDGIVEVISKIANIIIEAGTAIWNWILEHETFSLIVLTILGIAAVIFGGAFVSAVGIGILGGIILGGIVSWFSGNEFMSEAMLEDMLIWGIGTGIGVIAFEWVAAIAARLPLVVSIARKVPWLGKALPKMFGSAAGGGTDQSIIDFLKGQFSWKKTAIAAGLAFVLAFGGNYVANNFDQIIKWVNSREIPTFTQSFVKNGDSLASSMPMKIGDTEFGQWLQKFAKNGDKATGIHIDTAINKVSGKVFKTRPIDLKTEQYIVNRVKELRRSLPSKYKKSGNFALAEVHIDGISKTEFYAHSSIDELTGTLSERVPDISVKPKNPVFTAYQAPNIKGDFFPRDSDTEYKILNDLAARLGDNTKAVGKIKLFTELDTCASCSRVIAEFAKKYPNIELDIVHNNGNRLIK
ncbi:hypothetical protein H2C83_05230 [Thermoactinomyces sp. AMNI-1]|uniref:Uncharacterized protein n=2 Tax=Thermoactinomyces mirandus TaxID=2756294 RepID=A0A7W1XR32_9BACL|nr:hypothetical protein [Thermoactinomyces mirandus]